MNVFDTARLLEACARGHFQATACQVSFLDYLAYGVFVAVTGIAFGSLLCFVAVLVERRWWSS
jgi:hypothetical protein